MHAETPRSNLNDGVFAVDVKILVKSALARIIAYPELVGGFSECGVRVVTDRAVAHRRKHYGHRQSDLRRKRSVDPAVRKSLYFRGLFAEKHASFHRFAQRIYGRVRYLRRVYKDLIEVNGLRFRIAHRRQKHAAASRLLVNLFDRVRLPVGVFAEIVPVLYYFERMRGAKRHATLTIDAFMLVGDHYAELFVVTMNAVRALIFASAAVYATALVAHHVEIGKNIKA